MKTVSIQGGCVKLLLVLLVLCGSQAFADGRATTAIYSMKTVVVGVANTLFSDANPARAYLLVQNNGSVNIQIGFLKSSNPGIIIPPGGNYEPIKTPVDAIYLVSGTASQSVLIVEGQ